MRRLVTPLLLAVTTIAIGVAADANARGRAAGNPLVRALVYLAEAVDSGFKGLTDQLQTLSNDQQQGLEAIQVQIELQNVELAGLREVCEEGFDPRPCPT